MESDQKIHSRWFNLMMFVALAAILALGITGCGSSNDENADTSSTAGKNSGKTIALLLPETKTARYEAKDRPIFEKRVKQLCPDCKVIYSNAAQDASRQQQQAESAMVNGAQALVIDPVDSKSALSTVKAANERGIPVVAYDRPIMKSDLDYYVSFDYHKIGELQAQALVDALKERGVKPGSGKIVMLNGAPTDETVEFMKEGAHKVIDSSGFKVGAEYDTPDWSPDRAQEEMEQAITRLGPKNIAAVYSMNDGMAGAAIAAMKAAGISKMPPISGLDAELAGVQRIVIGDQTMTVFSSIDEQAKAAADLAVALANGEQPSSKLVNGEINNGKKQVPAVLLPAISVDQDNIEDTIVKSGFWKTSEICTAKYKPACEKIGLE